MSIRILQVITSLKVGGAEKLMVDIIPLLRQRGFDVDILIFNGEDTPFKEQLRKDGVRIIELSKDGSMYNPSYIFKLRKIIKGYDIVHAHNTPSQFFVAIANSLIKKHPLLVTTEHNTTNRRRSLKWFHFIDKWLYRQFEIIICISEKARKNLVEYLNNDNHIITINNGINIGLFSEAQSYSKTDLLQVDETVHLITEIAAFREQKDQDTLIRAIAQLTDDYHAVLVGDGPRRIICEQLAKELNISERVHFLGIRSDVARILKTSDIVVMSSHWEGLSLSSVEGMTVGKPFIASDVQGLHEVVEGAGLLFPHGDYSELASLIRSLMDDAKLYQATLEKCYQRALQYDITTMVDGYAGVYRHLFSGE
jgi:glycosyltransferase involved in cell wall biosynthesis